MNTPSDQSHQLAPVDTAPNFLASSTVPTISCTPTALQFQQQSASQDKLQRSHLSGEGPTATSRSHPRRSGKRGTPKRPYPCDICGKSYAQPQGVTRHHREAHRASVCTYCGDFRWGRPYQFRKHIKERHPNIDPDTVLYGRTGSRPKVTMISKCSVPRQRVFPNHEHDRRGRVESHLIPLAPPPSAVGEVTPLAPPPVMSSLDSDPQPQPPEPLNVTQTHEDLAIYGLMLPIPILLPQFHPRRSLFRERAAWKLLSRMGRLGWHIFFLLTTYMMSNLSTILSGIRAKGSLPARAKALPPTASSIRTTLRSHTVC